MNGQKRASMSLVLHPNAATNAPSHLLWCDRWIPVTRIWVMGEWGWRFKNGRDAADWLLWDED